MFKTIIKETMNEEKILKGDLANRIGKSINNLNNQMHRDNFTEKQMEEIADALGRKLTIKLDK